MFIELAPSGNYEYRPWNGSYLDIKKGAVNSDWSIEEKHFRPTGTGLRAIDFLTKLWQYIHYAHEEELNQFSGSGLTLTYLNSYEPNPSRIFHELKPACSVIRQIVQRITSGYDLAYFKRAGILKRIQDALYLIFGWETERDKIHQMGRDICQILHYASQNKAPKTSYNILGKSMLKNRRQFNLLIPKLIPNQPLPTDNFNGLLVKFL